MVNTWSDSDSWKHLLKTDVQLYLVYSTWLKENPADRNLSIYIITLQKSKLQSISKEKGICVSGSFEVFLDFLDFTYTTTWFEEEINKQLELSTSMKWKSCLLSLILSNWDPGKPTMYHKGQRVGTKSMEFPTTLNEYSIEN